MSNSGKDRVNYLFQKLHIEKIIVSVKNIETECPGEWKILETSEKLKLMDRVRSQYQKHGIDGAFHIKPIR